MSPHSDGLAVIALRVGVPIGRPAEALEESLLVSAARALPTCQVCTSSVRSVPTFRRDQRDSTVALQCPNHTAESRQVVQMTTTNRC